MIPTSSNYPNSFDTDDNLCVVHDSIRMRLVEDYNPGDTSIQTDGDAFVFSRMPPTGFITLTEQCSDVDLRAISFYYSGFDQTTGIISGLELLPTFTDVIKPKRITNVTMNVMDMHHNNLKDALIAMQKFFGVKGTTDLEPFGTTLEGRTNFLRKLVLPPKAWFTSDVKTGNVPLEVEFNNRSFRLGTDGTSNEVKATFDFGDQTTSIISSFSLIEGTSMVPDDGNPDILVRDTDLGKIKKIYHQPGKYTVKLTVENDFGADTVVFEDFINARVKAPDTAIVRFIENTSSQQAEAGVPPNGPFEVYPKIRSPINTLIQIEVEVGENPSTPGISYAGELLKDNGMPADPIVNWTWSLGDDLSHPNSRVASASYSVGGVYDMKLRADTEFGAYRITTYPDCIDIVENKNMWLWTFQSNNTVRSYEYGLISETFKTGFTTPLTVNRNDSFLNGVPEEARQKREFKRNTGFAPTSTTGSGRGGTALLYWASGRNPSDPVSSERINVVEYDGFTGTYLTKPSIARPWNWASLHSAQASYFIFGTVDDYPPGVSPTNTNKQTLDFSSMTVSSVGLNSGNYLNGASELQENVSTFSNTGESIYGNFSVLRTGWKDNNGYIMRNDAVGPFFRIKSFYRTEGTLSAPFTNIKKLQDNQGSTKEEGQLVSLTKGMYFLNNSGAVSLFDVSAEVWRSGGPGINSLLYRSLQDTSVVGYDNVANTLLATSDYDMRAYLSFDYSPSAFIRLSEIDLTYTTLGVRPSGEQWILGIF